MTERPKRLAFLLRDDSIPFYLRIAQELEKKGHEVYWITNNLRWKNYLTQVPIPAERIIFVPTYIRRELSQVDTRLIDTLEQGLPTFNLGRWILSDRGLRNVPYDVAFKMLADFGNQIHEAIKRHHLDFVIGEMTFSVEILTYYICQHLGVRYLYPDTVKIPSDRFCFFETPYYGSEFIRRTPSEQDLTQATRLYSGWRAHRTQPHFATINRRIPHPEWKWITKLLAWWTESDYLMANSSLLIRTKLELFVNYLYLKTVKFTPLNELPPDVRFAIYPLHKQPEASVDVTSPEFSNQLATIQNVARSLPHNFRLLIKEHNNAFGCRGHRFFSELRKLHNVILIEPDEDTFQTLDRCDLVFTIAGTMGFEAALLGKQVFTFSKVFYGDLRNVHYISDLTSLAKNVKLALAEPQFDEADVIGFLARLYANSYTGVRGNPARDPRIMTQENIQSWAHAFDDYVHSVPRRAN